MGKIKTKILKVVAAFVKNLLCQMDMETEYISTPVNILDLPNEILLRIFRFVPTYDLLKNLALVNNRFYELTKTPVNILNLPNEILLRIFRFVPTYDLLTNLALVNNRFYKLTKDNS